MLCPGTVVLYCSCCTESENGRSGVTAARVQEPERLEPLSLPFAKKEVCALLTWGQRVIQSMVVKGCICLEEPRYVKQCYSGPNCLSYPQTHDRFLYSLSKMN